MKSVIADVKTGTEFKTPGKGGNGMVYFVKSKSGKEYAIKIPLDKKNVQTTEINIMKKLSSSPNCHPSIVCYYGLAKTRFGKGIIMEYITGHDLFDLYEKDVKISTDQLYALMYHLFSGIKYMHSFGIAHRDIKLENIMFTDKELKIIDLGDACFFMKGNGKNSLCNDIRGTKECMSPEIGNKEILLHPELWQVCDVWALGIVMLEMATFDLDHPTGEELGKKYNTNYNAMQKIMSKYLENSTKSCDSGIKKAIKLSLVTNPKTRIAAEYVVECLDKIKLKNKNVFNLRLSI